MKTGGAGGLCRLVKLGIKSVCPHLMVTKCAGAGVKLKEIVDVCHPLEGTSLSQRLWAYRHGFLPDKLLLYNLTSECCDQYLPCLPYKTAHPFNGVYSRIIDNKLFLPYVLGQWPDVVPRYLFMFCGAEVVSLRPSGACREGGVASLSEVLAACREAGAIIIKPLADSGGQGVLKLEHTDGQWRLNGRPMPEPDLLERLGRVRNCLVEECVRQHPYSDAIFAGSVNTIRIVTMRDYDQGEHFIPYALHRIGSSASQPVDNWSSGGLCSSVDLETARLSRATEKAMKWHSVHPDTGAPIEGAQIANWAMIVDRIKEMANSLPFLPYMGWDVVVTADGFKILEINSLPGIYMTQAHKPLLTDNRVKAFMARHHALPSS